MTTSDKLQQTDLFPMELELMSSLEASPAKTSPLQGIKQVLKASAADSGQSAPVFLGRFDPGTPSLKTSQTCFLENGEIGLSEFSATFPRSGMMRSGTVYQLPNLARTITEIGSGSSVTQTQTFYWRTPDTGNGGTPKAFLKGETHRESGHAIQVRLSDQVKMWPTPTSNSAGEGEFIEQLVTKDGKKAAPNQRAYNPKTGIHTHITLNRAVQLWPTPNAGLSKHSYHKNSLSYYEKRISGGRQIDLAHKMSQVEQSGQLNPTWVEWLMGFPLGHTDLNA